MSRGIKEKFERRFGPELAEVVLERTGTHSKFFGSEVPENGDERLVYGLLEILDFKCLEHGCYAGGITEDEVKGFLLNHKEEVRDMNIDPPSFLGIVTGVFDFLKEGEE